MPVSRRCVAALQTGESIGANHVRPTAERASGMSSETDPTIWRWLADHLWAPLTGVVAVVWAMLNARIVRVEEKADAAVPKPDFRDYVEQDKEEHERLRQTQIKIFDKLDEIKTLIITRK